MCLLVARVLLFCVSNNQHVATILHRWVGWDSRSNCLDFINKAPTKHHICGIILFTSDAIAYLVCTNDKSKFVFCIVVQILRGRRRCVHQVKSVIMIFLIVSVATLLLHGDGRKWTIISRGATFSYFYFWIFSQFLEQTPTIELIWYEGTCHKIDDDCETGLHHLARRILR